MQFQDNMNRPTAMACVVAADKLQAAARARSPSAVAIDPDLFDGQAITKSGWMMADVAGCAV